MPLGKLARSRRASRERWAHPRKIGKICFRVKRSASWSTRPSCLPESRNLPPSHVAIRQLRNLLPRAGLTAATRYRRGPGLRHASAGPHLNAGLVGPASSATSSLESTDANSKLGLRCFGVAERQGAAAICDDWTYPVLVDGQPWWFPPFQPAPGREERLLRRRPSGRWGERGSEVMPPLLARAPRSWAGDS